MDVFFFQEYKCSGCKTWIREDEVIWATKDGKLDTDKGKPFCDTCLPLEKSRT
jgi:hypothetical protein